VRIVPLYLLFDDVRTSRGSTAQTMV
jgi:hypothetical protein